MVGIGGGGGGVGLVRSLSLSLSASVELNMYNNCQYPSFSSKLFSQASGATPGNYTQMGVDEGGKGVKFSERTRLLTQRFRFEFEFIWN